MANDDVSPGLLKKTRAAFEANLNSDSTAKNLLTKINNGTATYRDAGDYAECVGGALKKAMASNLNGKTLPDGKMYWHIGVDVLEPLMYDEYGLVAAAAAATQQGINTAAGMGLKAIRSKYNWDSVENIMGMACNADIYDAIAVEMGETMVTFAREIVEETMKVNAEFQSDSGRPPMIIRRAGAKCCPWCADLEGTYEYPNVPDDVYKRHDYCKCDVEYVTGSRKSGNNIWTKESWTSKDVLEGRKTYGL